MTLSVSLQHRFDGFALDVAFEAPPGITVLFGRSGSGKTSVINAVAGLLQPESGRIAVDGSVLLDTAQAISLPVHRRRLGYMFQDARLFPHMNVRRNLAYGSRFAPPGADAPRFDDVVDMLGLAHLLDRRPAKLSGGEKSRVALGRALLAAPRVLLADEPLAALDETTKSAILPYFERLRDELRLPVLYVSHSTSEVARLATTVVMLEQGRVARQGPPGVLFADPAFLPMGPRDAGALIEARLARHHDDGLSELEAGGAALFLPHVDAPEGAGLRLRIAAQDVMLSLDPPGRVSALNVLHAKVQEVRPGDGPGAMIVLDTAAGPLLARVTKRSAEALALTPGKPCYAVIKSVAIADSDIAAAAAYP